MVQVLWDASALAKRYTQESGLETVNAVFALGPKAAMFLTPWGYAETFSILLRKRNGGILAPQTFQASTEKLQQEVLLSSAFQVLSISDAMIFGCLSLMQAHSLNSADAAILATFLRFQHALPIDGSPCVLIASDKRLVRAAEAEGLRALNPEQIAPRDVPAFLAEG